jgi:hypothetical protein
MIDDIRNIQPIPHYRKDKEDKEDKGRGIRRTREGG